MSMEKNANDHFSEINMPSYPQPKMPKIHLCNSRQHLQETKSPFLLTWAMIQLQQLLEFQSGRRGGTGNAFSSQDMPGRISLPFLNALFQGNEPRQNSHGTTHLHSCSSVTLQMEGKSSFKSRRQRQQLYQSLMLLMLLCRYFKSLFQNLTKSSGF